MDEGYNTPSLLENNQNTYHLTHTTYEFLFKLTHIQDASLTQLLVFLFSQVSRCRHGLELQYTHRLLGPEESLIIHKVIIFVQKPQFSPWDY